MKLYQSSEDYLETILMLNQRMDNKVKSVDVAKELNVTKQSVHRAIKNLSENNYIEVKEKGYITLTEIGFSVASAMLERHNILTEYFLALGVSSEVASFDACQVEHYISDETFNAIKNNLKNIKA